MNRRLFGVFKSNFVRSVFVVAGGTAGAQFIAIVFSPIITRIYGPEAFGTLGFYVALLAILMPVAALTYPVAIVLPKEKAEAVQLAKLSVIVAFTVSLIATFMLLLGLYLPYSASKLVGEGILLFLIPLAMFFSALHQVYVQWMIRNKKFKITAKADVLQAFFLNFANVGAGFLYPVGGTLVILYTFSKAIHVFIIWCSARSQRSLEIFGLIKGFSRNQILTVAKKYKDFPLFRAPQAVISGLSMNVPVILLAFFFGAASVGFYSLARMVLAAPSLLVGKSIADVFYPKVTEAYNSGVNISKLILRVTLVLSAIGVFPLVLVLIFGPDLFSFIFGQEWAIAGEYAQWLSLFVFFNLINSPSVAAVSVLNIQRWFLGYSIFSAFMRISGLTLGYYLFGDPIGAIALFSIFGIIAYCYLIGKVIQTASRSCGQLV